MLQKLSRTILIKDDKGKEAPALDLFAQVIRYLKNHLLSALDTKGTTVNNKDIHWVLTVPAIWTDSAKQFMREAANKVHIRRVFHIYVCIGWISIINNNILYMFSQDLPRQRMNVNNYQCNTVLNGVITFYKKFFLVFSFKKKNCKI